MSSILTVTPNPCIDKSATVENVVPERKLRCSEVRYEPGGGGINVSRAIHKLGGGSTGLYLGGGTVGTLLEQLLRQEGIAYHSVKIKGLTRQNLMVYETATGQQFRFGMPGPEVTEAEWDQCLSEMGGLHPRPDYVVASGSLPPGVPPDFYARLARKVQGWDGRVILDTSGEPLRLAMEEGVFLVKPNLRELKDLAEKDLSEEAHQVAFARRLIDRGLCEAVVISLGAAGALLVSADHCERVRAPTVPIKSKVGAGDSMVAGMVLSLQRGRTLLDAVQFGVACGGAAVMSPGTELCRREDAERLHQQVSG